MPRVKANKLFHMPREPRRALSAGDERVQRELRTGGIKVNLTSAGAQAAAASGEVVSAVNSGRGTYGRDYAPPDSPRRSSYWNDRAEVENALGSPEGGVVYGSVVRSDDDRDTQHRATSSYGPAALHAPAQRVPDATVTFGDSLNNWVGNRPVGDDPLENSLVGTVGQILNPKWQGTREGHRMLESWDAQVRQYESAGRSNEGYDEVQIRAPGGRLPLSVFSHAQFPAPGGSSVELGIPEHELGSTERAALGAAPARKALGDAGMRTHHTSVRRYDEVPLLGPTRITWDEGRDWPSVDDRMPPTDGVVWDQKAGSYRTPRGS